MKNYAKLINGLLLELDRVPHVSNPSPFHREEYALTHGYKPLLYKESPGLFYTPGWHETEKRITQTWSPWELTDAKASAMQRVQAQLDFRLSARTVIPCIAIPAGIIYDSAALTNALGLASGDEFIDAADHLHTLNTDMVDNIRSSLKNYRMGLYAAATDCRRRIAEADSVDAVAEIVKLFEEEYA